MGHQESKMAKFFLLLCLMAAMAYAASDVESFDHAEHGEASDMIQLREENARLRAELKEAKSMTSPSPKKALGESSGNNAGLIIPSGCSASDDRCYEQYTGKACSTSGAQYTMSQAKAECGSNNNCHGFRASGSKYKLCTNPRQNWSSSSGTTTYAKQGPLNSAKCAGPAQDHRALTGTLDCSHGGGDTGGEIELGSRQDEQCPDNVSNGKYLQINLAGVISCKPLGDYVSITRQATNVQPEHDGEHGFKTKNWPSSHKNA